LSKLYIKTRDFSGGRSTLVFNNPDGTIFEIQQFSQSDNICKITSETVVSAENFFALSSSILSFLTFVKGTYCGLGHVEGFTTNDEKAFELIGFARRDETRESNWFDIGIQSSLPEIYELFSEKQKNEEARLALMQSIEFYRASIASRKVSLETSIIASQTALEALVNFILEFEAGWSNNLLRNRQLKFSNKFRAAACYFRIGGNLLKHSPELAQLSKSHNSHDIYEIIPLIRNKLVHQDVKHSATGIQLHETWQISQWMVEVLFFAIIGFRGEIIDRRPYGRDAWSGTKCQLPFN